MSCSDASKLTDAINAAVKNHKETPQDAAVKDVSPLVPVTNENVDAFAKNWEKWLPK